MKLTQWETHLVCVSDAHSLQSHASTPREIFLKPASFVLGYFLEDYAVSAWFTAATEVSSELSFASGFIMQLVLLCVIFLNELHSPQNKYLGVLLLH